MDYMKLGQSDLMVPRIGLGCLHIGEKSREDAAEVIRTALEVGINFFDHADIYLSEEPFREAVDHLGIRREDMILQSKAGIADNSYDFSYDYLMDALDGSLERLGTDYLDVFLLHRPDALMETTEVARFFEDARRMGKIRWLGVSNFNPGQIQLSFSEITGQDRPVTNQLQLSLTDAPMIAHSLNVNLAVPSGVDYSSNVLDYCRLNGITIQAWSPVRSNDLEDTFLGSEKFKDLNKVLTELAGQYEVQPETIAIAWILRHPAGIQPIIGTMSPGRIRSIIKAIDITLSRDEWYRLYSTAGHNMP